MQEQEGPDEPVRVLLVEDDPRAAVLISTTLRAAWPDGLVVVHAQRLADAVRELRDHGATCVLLDLAQQPEPIDALEQLTAAALHVPVIVLSERVDDELEVAALRAGAQDHLLRDELTPGLLGRAVRYAIERKRSVAALALAALHDPLTELPNRALFLDRLRGGLDRARRTGEPVVVLFLDVDDFKQINDTRGHAAGDMLMTKLADRFRGLLRPMDTVARFGGDEFTFVLEGIGSEREAADVADRISRSAARPLALPGGAISVAVSIGVALVTDPGTPIDEILHRADTAMYRAKESGGARVELSDGAGVELSDGAGVELSDGAGVELSDGAVDAAPAAGAGPPSDGDSDGLERALRQAVARSELRVHYQPRVSLNERTGLVGFEALVRWEHPERGLMEPVEFMPLAERTGLIVPIGEWVLGQALHQVRRWRQTRPGMTISVNLSRRQLGDPELLSHLTDTIRNEGHDPSVLCLEVSEGALRAEPEVATRQLTALNDMGVRLAIDDFGTANSSAADLRHMPVHILKIDQTLVSRLGRDGDGGGAGGAGGVGDLGGVGAAVELGHTLGLCVVAEGVETDAQLAAVRELGCDGAQGYLFSGPVPEESVYSMLG